MKYFTPAVWKSWQAPGYRRPPPENDPFHLYQAELATLRDRLPPDAFSFFSDANVHDGELLDFRVVDGSRPAPPDENAAQWQSPDDYPVTVSLRVLDAYDRLVWTLRYAAVRRVLVDFPGRTELFPTPGGGFGDWGYHELLDAGDGFLHHEVLFSTGAVLLVEFPTVHVTSGNRREAAEQGDEADEA